MAASRKGRKTAQGTGVPYARLQIKTRDEVDVRRDVAEYNARMYRIGAKNVANLASRIFEWFKTH